MAASMTFAASPNGQYEVVVVVHSLRLVFE
jgi:hypothetical protein